MYRYLHFDQLGNFFIFSGIATVIITRTFLHLSGYPQIGSASGLHVAHVLFGGLLMMLALMLLFNFITHTRFLFLTAIIGGVGFGLFIDEIGKFVTKDVDYFFKPAFVIMYVIFILMFVLSRLFQQKHITQEEYLLNSVETLKDAVLQKMNPFKQQQMLEYLTQCKAEPTLVPALASYYSSLKTTAYNSGWQNKLEHKYHAFVYNKWFLRVLSTFFLLEAMWLIFYVFVFSLNDGFMDLAESVSIITSAIRSVLILLGIFFLYKSHLRSYHFFWYATILSITILQLFRLYDDPFYALIWLFIDGFILLNLRILTRKEQLASN